MRITESTAGARPSAWLLLAAVAGFLLASGVLLLFFHSRVLAEPAVAMLNVEKTVNATVAEPGDTLTYTVRVWNSGDAPAYGAWLTDTLPVTLTYVADSLVAGYGTAGIQGRVITWTADLGYETWVTYSAQISSGIEGFDVVNVAEVAGTGDVVTDSASTLVRGTLYLYLPVVCRRWPPIPYPPVLDPIANSDHDGDYTVSWTYPYTEPAVITYTLQEATSASFAVPTNYYPGSSTSKVFAGKDSATYYYRVRGNNTWGPGEWSNVVSTLVAGYADEFNDPGSGWHIVWDQHNPTEPLDPDWAQVSYTGGKLRLKITEQTETNRTRWNKILVSPAVGTLTNDYVLETRIDFTEHVWLTAYGVVFGANHSYDKFYRLLLVYTNDYLKMKVKRIDGGGAETTLRDWQDVGAPYVDSRGWNTWRIEYAGGRIKIYANGHKLVDIAENQHHYGYFGLWMETDEYTPAQIDAEYFRITPK